MPIGSHDTPVVPPMKGERTVRQVPHFLPPVARRTRVSALPQVDDFPSQPYSRSVGVPPTFFISISAFQFSAFQLLPNLPQRHRHHPNANPALRQQRQTPQIKLIGSHASRLSPKHFKTSDTDYEYRTSKNACRIRSWIVHQPKRFLDGRHAKISFNRTLRIPEDGKTYPLPAGMGRLPIHRVEDYADKVPESWLKEGGYFIPLYQSEALFLEFNGPKWHPSIAKVCVGKINAISGEFYSEKLSGHKQDYVVIPDQHWLDGINSGNGVVRQFVAMPLGKGYTIEAQISDEEIHGGFQLLIFDAVEGQFADRDPAIDRLIEKIKRARSQSLYDDTLHDKI